MKLYEYLTLSNDKFEEIITDNQIKDFDLDRNPHANREELLIFANLAYDKDDFFTNSEEELLKILPSGWMLLTYGYSKYNDYFGIALWCPSRHHVAIAHRGTAVGWSLGAIIADYRAVYMNSKNSSHMLAAITFVERIAKVIRDINNKQGSLSHQISLTGHSLGGFLAAVTTYTAEYLVYDPKKKEFIREESGLHPHTITFDSPGSEQMMRILRDEYDDRCSHQMLINDLDITTYMIQENIVNVTNDHVGTVFLIMNNGCTLSPPATLNLKTHSLSNFSFENIKGEFLVKNWPKGVIEKTWSAWMGNNRKSINKRRSNEIDQRIFTQSEIIFLETWRNLKSTKINTNLTFSFLKIKNNPSGVKLLKDFDIEKKLVKCDTEDELQCLIKRTKQLVRWYHKDIMEVLQKAFGLLPSAFYSFLNKTYLDSVGTLSLDCEDTLGLGNFLRSDHTVLCIEAEDTTLQARRFHNLLSKMEEMKQQYTFLHWNNLLHDLKLNVDVENLHKDKNFIEDNILIVDCATLSYTSNIESLKNLVLNMKTNSTKKIVIICLKNSVLLKLLKAKITTITETITLKDLTKESVDKLLKREVLDFGGAKMSFEKLLFKINTDNLQWVIGNQLIHFLTDETFFITLESSLPESGNVIYDENLSLKRRFHNKHNIDFDKLIEWENPDTFLIGNLKKKEDLAIALKITEECEIMLNKNLIYDTEDSGVPQGAMNVHYLRLETDEGGHSQLVWESSNGSLQHLRSYVSRDVNQSVDERELCTIDRRLVIITGDPGTGKTTFIKSIRHHVGPEQWIVCINLKVCQAKIEKIPTVIDMKSAIDFLTPNQSDHSTGIERRLLQLCLQPHSTRQVLLEVDGFDEFRSEDSEEMERKVIDLLKFFINNTSARIFITSRTFPKEYLENELLEFSTEFQHINEEDQINFLMEYWKAQLEIIPQSFNEEKIKLLRQQTIELYKKLEDNLGQGLKLCMGVPLQLKMLAVIHQKSVTHFLNNSMTNNHILFEIKSSLDLYKTFIKTKMNFDYKSGTNIEIYDQSDNISVKIRDHQLLAFKIFDKIFTKQVLKEESKINYRRLIELNRYGIIQLFRDGNYQFIHHTYAEYFLADFVISWLQQKDSSYMYILLEEFFLSKILLNPEYQVVRTFIEDFLTSSAVSDSNNVIKVQNYIGNKIIDILKRRRLKTFRNKNFQTALHVSVIENRKGITTMLLNCSNRNSLRDVSYISFIAARDNDANTALYLSHDMKNREVILDVILQFVDTCSTYAKKKILLATFCKWNQIPKHTANKLLYKLMKSGSTSGETCDICKRIIYLFKVKVNSLINIIKKGTENEIEKEYNSVLDDNERYYLPLATNKRGEIGFSLAAENGYINMVKLFFNDDVLMLKDRLQMTPLHYAMILSPRGVNNDFFSGQQKVIEFLLSKNMNIDIECSLGMTPLLVAILEGNTKALTRLLDCKADPNQRCLKYIIQLFDFDISVGNTPLIISVHNQEIEMVKYLLKKRADPDCCNSNGDTALLVAVWNEYEDIVDCLLNGGANPNCKNYNGDTPIIIARNKNNKNIINSLIAKGADSNSTIENKNQINEENENNIRLKSQWSRITESTIECEKKALKAMFLSDVNEKRMLKYRKPKAMVNKIVSKIQCQDMHPTLLEAANSGQNVMLQHLIGNCGDSLVSKNPNSSLLFINHNGHVDIVKNLTKNIAEVKCINTVQETPLLSPAQDEHTGILKQLVKMGAMVTCGGKKLHTLLIHAIRNVNIDEVIYLLENGADVNSSSHEDTPLLVASECGNLEIVKYLIKRGAEVNGCNSSGDTPLMVAERNGYVKLVNFLLKKGAKRDCVNSNDDTPLIVAARKGLIDIYEYICKSSSFYKKWFGSSKTEILLFAVGYSNVSKVKLLVEEGTDVNCKDEYGTSPLSVAISVGNFELVRYLIENGANVNGVDPFVEPPLILALQEGDMKIVKHLVMSGADVNEIPDWKSTLLSNAARKGQLDVFQYLITISENLSYDNLDKQLLLAAKYGRLEMVELLIDNGGNFNCTNFNGDTPLLVAARNGNLNVVKYLAKHGPYINFNVSALLLVASENGHILVVMYLVEMGVDINVTDSNYETPLLLAAQNGHIKLVKYLISQGASQDSISLKKDTPLLRAAQNSFFDIVIHLINNGANINCVDVHERTALFYAAMFGELDMVKSLVNLGLFINCIDANKDTPLILAARNGHIEVVTYLVAKGSEFNCRNANGEMPLLCAARNNHLEVIEHLFEVGADLNCVNNHNGTPLLMCAQYGDIESVMYLVNNGADLNSCDNDGNNLLLHGVLGGNEKVVKYILSKTADVNVRNKKGETALIIAAKKGYSNLVSILLKHGASTKVRDNAGKTAFNHAKREKHTSVMKIISPPQTIREFIVYYYILGIIITIIVEIILILGVGMMLIFSDVTVQDMLIFINKVSYMIKSYFENLEYTIWS